MQEIGLRELADRMEIAELMARYADMVDRRDWTRMDRIFALEATIDLRPAGGRAGPFREMLAWLDRALDSWPRNLHMITNLIVELEGDRANARCYFHVPTGRDAREGEGAQFTVTHSGRYLDRLIHTADGWRIVERVCEQVVREGNLPEGWTPPL